MTSLLDAKAYMTSYMTMERNEIRKVILTQLIAREIFCRVYAPWKFNIL